jgi:multidrug efflux pump subunit AcrA (membrane-fusion protein)
MCHPPPQVGVAQPLQQDVTQYLALTGNAVAINEVDLVARVEGFLQSISYQDGAPAKQGDKLFVIEPAPYDAKLQQVGEVIPARHQLRGSLDTTRFVEASIHEV